MQIKRQIKDSACSDDGRSNMIANDIQNQLKYFRTYRDKDDNTVINTLQDINDTKGCFVKLKHTVFSSENKMAMSLLIILLERKNEILKNLAKISTQREYHLEKLA